MYAQVEKSKENRSRAVANSFGQKKNNGRESFGIVDNRPGALPIKSEKNPIQKFTTITHQQAAIQRVRAKKTTETQEEYDAKLDKFNTYKIKGKGYWDALVSKLNEESLVDKDYDAVFSSRYSTTVSAGADTPSNVKGFAGKADKYVTKVKGGEAGKDPYENYMDPTSGRIVASYNYGDKDINTDESGDTKRLPNSEILYQQYKQAVEEKDDEGVSISGLTEVVRSSIQNQDTMAVISLCITSVLEKFNEKAWQPGSDEFNALLGTDNCKGIAFMLKDHASSFGKKTITSIVTKGENYIRIKLGNKE